MEKTQPTVPEKLYRLLGNRGFREDENLKITTINEGPHESALKIVGEKIDLTIADETLRKHYDLLVADVKTWLGGENVTEIVSRKQLKNSAKKTQRPNAPARMPRVGDSLSGREKGPAEKFSSILNDYFYRIDNLAIDIGHAEGQPDFLSLHSEKIAVRIPETQLRKGYGLTFPQIEMLFLNSKNKKFPVQIENAQTKQRPHALRWETTEEKCIQMLRDYFRRDANVAADIGRTNGKPDCLYLQGEKTFVQIPAVQLREGYGLTFSQVQKFFAIKDRSRDASPSHADVWLVPSQNVDAAHDDAQQPKNPLIFHEDDYCPRGSPMPQKMEPKPFKRPANWGAEREDAVPSKVEEAGQSRRH